MTTNIEDLRREYQSLCDFIFNAWYNESISSETMAEAEEKAEKVLVLINALEAIDNN